MFFSVALRVFGQPCRWMRRSWMQLSAQLGVSSLSSQSGRVENSKVEPSECFMIKSSLIVLHIHVGLFSFSALSIFQFYNRLACLACRFCPFGIRVSSRRLSNPLGSSCWHERQDAGWSLQDWLALQVNNNNNKEPSGWSCEGALSLPVMLSQEILPRTSVTN